MIPFSGNPLDRASERRTDKAWLAEMRAAGGAQVVPLWRLHVLLEGAEGTPDARANFGGRSVQDRFE